MVSDNKTNNVSGEAESENTPEQDRALTVSGRDLVEFLNRVAPDNKCSFCNRGDYNVISAPTKGGIAGVVATPVPNVQHLGIWFFVASCNVCGHTALFNSKEVLDAMDRND